MKLKLKRISKIICIILIVIVIFMPMSQVFGQINPNTTDTGWTEMIKGFLGRLLALGTGPLTTAIAGLINAVLGIVFLLLCFVFAPMANGFIFPFPDQIIFNKVPFFDPNFINPTKNNLTVNSPVVLLQDLIKSLYYTGFIIAGTVFLIAAMVIGIKLAASTIASEKAHYKQALMAWVTGLFLLFTTHFIMLLIFTVNEKIVEIVSVASADIEFKVEKLNSLPVVGSTIGKALTTSINAVAGLFGATESITDTTVHGYGGLLIKFAAYAIGGDLVSSIIWGILLGQTCALIVMYIKRLFYSLMLGMVAPLIVAADVLKKTL